jgi:hypothetical protein
MKTIITALLLLCTTIVSAQKDANEFKGRKKPYSCSDIINVNNELSGKSEKRLPNDFILSPINFDIVKTPEIKVNVLTFSIPYYPYNTSENGVYFKLANGEILKYSEAKVDVSYSRSGSYSLYCSIAMDDNIINKLKESFIIQFSVGDKTINIEERNYTNLHTLFSCMFSEN